MKLLSVINKTEKKEKKKKNIHGLWYKVCKNKTKLQKKSPVLIDTIQHLATCSRLHHICCLLLYSAPWIEMLGMPYPPILHSSQHPHLVLRPMIINFLPPSRKKSSHEMHDLPVGLLKNPDNGSKG